MSWTLAWLLALLLEVGDPHFDPELVCLDPGHAWSPLCAAGPWAELLAGAAAPRARLLFAIAGWHDALGDAAAADKARQAAEEALALALTDRGYAAGWLDGAREALAALRTGRAGAAAGDAGALGLDGAGYESLEARRGELATAREQLRRH